MSIQDLQGNLHARNGQFTHKPAGVEDDANQVLPIYEDDFDKEEFEEDNFTVFVDTFDDRGFEVDRPDAEDDQYTVYEGDEQVAVFECSADPGDHDEIWSQALAAMEAAGAIRLCADCRQEPPEGDDTVCATCY